MRLRNLLALASYTIMTELDDTAVTRIGSHRYIDEQLSLLGRDLTLDVPVDGGSEGSGSSIEEECEIDVSDHEGQVNHDAADSSLRDGNNNTVGRLEEFAYLDEGRPAGQEEESYDEEDWEVGDEDWELANGGEDSLT